MDEQQQRQQARGLGLTGHQQEHEAREPDRLGGEVVAREVAAGGRHMALVEHQVEHREHGREAFGQRVGIGHADRDARRAQLALGAHEPLRDRRLRDEQAASHLGHGEAADQSQRQRHLGLLREGRVTAGEHERQALVGDHVLLVGEPGDALLELARELDCLERSTASRRRRSIARRLAAVKIHAPGLSGTPSFGQRSSATT